MREESRRAANAFLKRKPIDLARTHTTEDSLYLHGNQIAWRESDDRGDAIVMTLSGWATTVTKERLNTLCEMLFHERPFSTRKGVSYFGSYQIRADTLIRIPMKGDQPEFTCADDIMAAALMTGEFTPGTPDWSDVVAKRIAKLQTYARAYGAGPDTIKGLAYKPPTKDLVEYTNAQLKALAKELSDYPGGNE